MKTAEKDCLSIKIVFSKWQQPKITMFKKTEDFSDIPFVTGKPKVTPLKKNPTKISKLPSLRKTKKLKKNQYK